MVCGHSQNMVTHGCNSEGGVMKRDLYAEVSTRIIAELCAAFLCAEFSLDGELRHAG